MVGLECKLMACKSFWTNLFSDSREFMTEDASGSFHLKLKTSIAVHPSKLAMMRKREAND